jgi:hypothetical protein
MFMHSYSILCEDRTHDLLHNERDFVPLRQIDRHIYLVYIICTLYYLFSKPYDAYKLGAVSFCAHLCNNEPYDAYLRGY